MVVTNPKSVADFYSAVIGYTLAPCVEGEGKISYSLVNGAGKEAFGICDQRSFPKWTGGWVLYLEVENLHERVARIKEHGGEIVGYWPREAGRRAESLFRDPSGAGVMLQESLDSEANQPRRAKAVRQEAK